MDAATFRADFPEFASTTTYPDALVTFWLTVAGKLVNLERWGDLANQGIELLAAHNIVVEERASRTAAAGGSPGQASGALASKQVKDVSMSFDTATAAEADAGQYNLTVYGQRYFRLAVMMGAGGIQL